MSDQYILGISAYYHDSAAALLRNGEIVAAAHEERFTRKKGDPDFPKRAVAFCLETAGITPAELTHVGFYDKPLLKFERILETYMGVVPKGFRSYLMAGPLWIKDKLYIDRQLKEELGWDGHVLYALLVTPASGASRFAQAFDRMVDSLRVDDRSAHR